MRDHDTYRSERRNAWRAEADAGVPWRHFNTREGSTLPWGIGSNPNPQVTMRKRPRSKYMPHQGNREMARRVEQATAIRTLMTRSSADAWKAWPAA